MNALFNLSNILNNLNNMYNVKSFINEIELDYMLCPICIKQITDGFKPDIECKKCKGQSNIISSFQNKLKNTRIEYVKEYIETDIFKKLLLTSGFDGDIKADNILSDKFKKIINNCGWGFNIPSRPGTNSRHYLLQYINDSLNNNDLIASMSYFYNYKVNDRITSEIGHRTQYLHNTSDEIGYVCTDVPYRRKGYVSYLMNYVLDNISSPSIPWLWCDTAIKSTMYLGFGFEYIRNKKDMIGPYGIQYKYSNILYMKYRPNILLPNHSNLNHISTYNNVKIYRVTVANQNANHEPTACGYYVSVNILMMFEACKSNINALDDINNNAVVKSLVKWYRNITLINQIINSENQPFPLPCDDSIINHKNNNFYTCNIWNTHKNIPFYMSNFDKINFVSYKKDITQNGDYFDTISNNYDDYKYELYYLQNDYVLNIDLLINSTILIYQYAKKHDDDRYLIRLLEGNNSIIMNKFIITQNFKILANFYMRKNYVFALQIAVIEHWVSVIINKTNNNITIYFMDSLGHNINSYNGLSNMLVNITTFDNFGALLNTFLLQTKEYLSKNYYSMIDNILADYNNLITKQAGINGLIYAYIDDFDLHYKHILNIHDFIYADDLHNFAEWIDNQNYITDYKKNNLSAGIYDYVKNRIKQKLNHKNINKESILKMNI